MSKYNVDLMLAVREQITSHPEMHYQDAYGRPAPRAGGLTSGKPIWDRAQELLGLPSPAAGNLFHTMSESAALTKLDELIEEGKNQS